MELKKNDALVLDACCGSRMFWFDKNNPITLFHDKREIDTSLCDGRQLIVNPDVIGDFTCLEFESEKFKLVILDPPHLKNVGEKSWTYLKYGKLPKDFKPYLKSMFDECFRVLESDGILIFKWNEDQIKTSEIVALSPYSPMVGHKSGKQQRTHWIVFMKNDHMKISEEL